MHARNRYRRPYDLTALARRVPALAPFVHAAPAGHPTVDFHDPAAVRALNRALLVADYGLQRWDLPADNLCPAVPGRLDYVHVVADLLADLPPAFRAAPTRGLDIGTGASLIYPVLGVREYGWRFVATELDPASARAARAIAEFNDVLRGRVEVRSPASPRDILTAVVRPGERFAFSMCNPPFFTSEAGAQRAAANKWRKLGRADATRGLNFGGRATELWTEGGEPAFLRRYIAQSAALADRVGWFTTLVSQRGYLDVADRAFRKVRPRRREVVPLVTGSKKRRVLAWGW